jgi:hypothetical protein
MSPHDRCPIARRCPLRNLSISGAEDTCEILGALLKAILRLHENDIAQHRARMDAMLRGDYPQLPSHLKRP